MELAILYQAGIRARSHHSLLCADKVTTTVYTIWKTATRSTAHAAYVWTHPKGCSRKKPHPHRGTAIIFSEYGGK